MKLYVANCTMQAHDFVYRLPETQSNRTQRIEVGQQIQISGDLTTPEIDAIVEQHARYGMVPVVEIDRTKPFVGVCYSVDKPVAVDKIRIALAHNNDVLTARGKEIRQQAAIVVSNQIEEQTPQLTALEMSVVEDTKGKAPEVAEGVRVSRTEGNSPTPVPTRRQRRAA